MRKVFPAIVPSQRHAVRGFGPTWRGRAPRREEGHRLDGALPAGRDPRCPPGCGILLLLSRVRRSETRGPLTTGCPTEPAHGPTGCYGDARTRAGQPTAIGHWDFLRLPPDPEPRPRGLRSPQGVGCPHAEATWPAPVIRMPRSLRRQTRRTRPTAGIWCEIRG